MAVRMTMQTLMVLQALLRDPVGESYGLKLAEKTGLLPGTTYPILLRLEKDGWVTSWWEEISPEAEGRPRRRYYRLTATGAAKASSAIAAARQPARAMLRGLTGEGGYA